MELETREKNLITEGSDVIEDRLTQPQISDDHASQIPEQVTELSQLENAQSVKMADMPRNGKIKSIQELPDILRALRSREKCKEKRA